MRPPILIRLSNALDALRGRPCSHKVDAMTIELNVDTSKLEEGLARAKARLAEFEAANKLPSPKLMLRVDKKLSYDERQRLMDTFRLAAESGKHLVVEPGMTVYQLAAGRWEPIEKESSEPLTEDEVRLANGWTKEQVVTEGGVVEEWREPDPIPPEDAALLKTRTQTIEVARSEFGIPADRLRAD